MLKDYKTLEKAQHFIEGRKFYSDVHGLFTEFVRFYTSRLDAYTKDEE